MYLLTVHPGRELVHMAFVGHFDVDDAKRSREEMGALLPTLKPAFCLLTDFSALEEMDYSCSDDIRSMMDQLREYGVSRIVRVIPDPRKDIGFTTMSLFHYGRDVSIHTVESLAEALPLIQP